MCKVYKNMKKVYNIPATETIRVQACSFLCGSEHPSLSIYKSTNSEEPAY